MASHTPDPAASTAAREALLQLSRSGRLTTEYNLVQGLLRSMSRADLVQAGQLLSRLDSAEVSQKHPDIPMITVALTGHGTLSPLRPLLTAELARHGLITSPLVMGFGTYIFDLGDPGSSLYASNPDLTLCVLDPMVVLDDLPVPWKAADAERAMTEKIRLIERLVAQFQAQGRGTLVVNTMPLPHRFAAQLIDYRSRARLGAAWREGNAALLRLPDAYPATVVIDLDPLVAEGIPATDARFSVYTGLHLSQELLARYARDAGHLARIIAGRLKKVLALDLDGTVWGGVLGEDGPAGIEVADSTRGQAFRAFQRAIRQLGAQGVLLAAVSKNDPEPVTSVLRSHPRMTLREDDFVRITANWQPKHENIARLAADLNLGVDSFVLVDDSSYECGLMRTALPDVTVVEVDQEPASHLARLLEDDWFASRELTEEDRRRGAGYRTELARREFSESFGSVADYLRELNISVRLAAAEPSEISRISQLTLRTNQFNLTTLRMQSPAVEEAIADPAASVLAVHASDRFGDNGIVGAMFLYRVGTAVRIDNFLMSCRVLSRGIEQACLAAVLQYARSSGADTVFAEYRQTKKNEMVRDFYPECGFIQVDRDGTATTFRHDLAECIAPAQYIALTAALEGEST
jgi:FkbH-like protein